jgi:hypothetical protein
MKLTFTLLITMGCVVSVACAQDEAFDRIDPALTWSNRAGSVRVHASGSIDVEAYVLPRPAPGAIDTQDSWLLNPRAVVFLDGQFGDSLYGFAQARVDRGFDPSDDRAEARLDEYALRWTPWSGSSFHLQAGRFATVVGNWTTRHDSWSNPFVTAPLLYENLTGVWDNQPPRNVATLLAWSHVRPGLSPSVDDVEKYLRLPMIWGPSYATGFAAAGSLARFRYAAEIKNASLSSRPEAWSIGEARWDHPTYSARLRFVPSPTWDIGVSASTGTFLRPIAEPMLIPGTSRGQYRQTLAGCDVAYAWHHLQVWAELYATRFSFPLVGDADTWAYYVEARYKFTPGFSGAVRWNQQLFGTMRDRGDNVRWGHDAARIDFAPEIRLTANTQFKLQYSGQQGDEHAAHLVQFAAAQLTLRF